MMKKHEIVAAIDVGSANIVAAIAEIKQGKIRLLNAVDLPSSGVKKGVVINVAHAHAQLAYALSQLHHNTTYEVASMVVSLTDQYLRGVNVDGSSYTTGGIVHEKDRNNAIERARKIAENSDYQLLHMLLHFYNVNDRTEDEFEDPVGIEGNKVTACMHAVSVRKETYKNLAQLLKRSNINIRYAVASGYAAALAATTADEREFGVCVIDIGKSVTNITIIRRDLLIYIDTIAHGGEEVTNALSSIARLSSTDAEKLKQQIDLSKPPSKEEFFTLKDISGQNQDIKGSDVFKVVSDSLTELFSSIVERLDSVNALNTFPGGIVLCGGGASFLGFEKWLAENVNLPVRVAKIDLGLSGFEPSSRYATLMGLFHYYNLEMTDTEMTSQDKASILYRIATFIGWGNGR